VRPHRLRASNRRSQALCAESIVKVPRLIEAHFVPGPHRLQTAVEFAAVFRIGGAGKVFDIGMEKEPILRRSPVHNLHQFSAAHPNKLIGSRKKASRVHFVPAACREPWR